MRLRWFLLFPGRFRRLLNPRAQVLLGNQARPKRNIYAGSHWITQMGSAFYNSLAGYITVSQGRQMGVPCGKWHGWEPHSWSLKPPPRVSLMAQAALGRGCARQSHTQLVGLFPRTRLCRSNQAPFSLEVYEDGQNGWFLAHTTSFTQKWEYNTLRLSNGQSEIILPSTFLFPTLSSCVKGKVHS